MSFNLKTSVLSIALASFVVFAADLGVKPVGRKPAASKSSVQNAR